MLTLGLLLGGLEAGGEGELRTVALLDPLALLFHLQSQFLSSLIFNVRLQIFNFDGAALNIFTLQALVESVLDLANCPAQQGLHLAELGPFGAVGLVHPDDEIVLLGTPVSAHDSWVQYVMPPLSALAA